MIVVAWWAPLWLALGLGAALFLARGELAATLRLSRQAWAARLGLVGLALAVRLAWLPALGGHAYDGHEAEYYAIFLGERGLVAGDTTLYPAVQALWWGLGHLLPHAPWAPVLVSVGVGVVGMLALGGLVGRLSEPRAAPWAMALVALHPAHAAWSTSAYNVILPHTLAACALWVASLVPTAARPVPLRWVAGLLLGLAVCGRLEVLLYAAPLALLLRGQPRAALLPLGVGVGGGALAAGALAALGGVPGEGERLLSFWNNLGFLAPYGAWGAPLGLLLVALGCAGALRWPGTTLALVGGAVLAHAGLATFDDMGERHALTALPGLLWALCAGGLVLGRWAPALPTLAGLLLLPGLVGLRATYDGDEARFRAILDEEAPWAELPRLTVSRPPDRSPYAPDCGWVAEDARISESAALSHFNLLDPAEADRHRGVDGCLHWCVGVEDWRWSSRGVRDRAARLAHLYRLEPVGVVEAPASGYACVVMAVGARRCCGPGLPILPRGGSPALPE